MVPCQLQAPSVTLTVFSVIPTVPSIISAITTMGAVARILILEVTCALPHSGVNRYLAISGKGFSRASTCTMVGKSVSVIKQSINILIGTADPFSAISGASKRIKLVRKLRPRKMCRTILSASARSGSTRKVCRKL